MTVNIDSSSEINFLEGILQRLECELGIMARNMDDLANSNHERSDTDYSQGFDDGCVYADELLTDQYEAIKALSVRIGDRIMELYPRPNPGDGQLPLFPDDVISVDDIPF